MIFLFHHLSTHRCFLKAMSLEILIESLHVDHFMARRGPVCTCCGMAALWLPFLLCTACSESSLHHGDPPEDRDPTAFSLWLSSPGCEMGWWAPLCMQPLSEEEITLWELGRSPCLVHQWIACIFYIWEAPAPPDFVILTFFPCLVLGYLSSCGHSPAHPADDAFSSQLKGFCI